MYIEIVMVYCRWSGGVPSQHQRVLIDWVSRCTTLTQSEQFTTL